MQPGVTPALYMTQRLGPLHTRSASPSTPTRSWLCSDIRLLYETLQGPRLCSGREREKLTVALAKVEVAVAAARSAKAEAQEQVRGGGQQGGGRRVDCFAD